MTRNSLSLSIFCSLSVRVCVSVYFRVIAVFLLSYLSLGVLMWNFHNGKRKILPIIVCGKNGRIRLNLATPPQNKTLYSHLHTQRERETDTLREVHTNSFNFFELPGICLLTGKWYDNSFLYHFSSSHH